VVAERLAMPSNLRQLEPFHPAHLDSFLQQECTTRQSVTMPGFVERLFRLSGLFAPHLVIHEAQILDHLAMRDFFLGLSADPARLREAYQYLTDPGLDPLELGPVVLSSEPFDKVDKCHPFLLSKLLERKLGLDDLKYDPWELSSIYDVRLIEEAHREIQHASGPRRLELAHKYMDPQGHYGEYLRIVSTVWDDRASVTRIPWQEGKVAFHTRLRDMLLQRASQRDDATSDSATKLVEMLSSGQRIVLPDGTDKQIKRSTINPWLRNKPGWDELKELVNRAYYDTFVLSFPSGSGWVSSDHTGIIKEWKGPEPAAEPRVKLPMPTAVATAAMQIDTKGPIILDKLTYADLLTLRKNKDFQASLLRIQEEWGCHRFDVFQGAFRDHVDLVYKILKLKDRSSTKREDGPNAVVEILVGLSKDPLTYALAAGAIVFNWAGFGAAGACVVLKNIWTWRRRGGEIRRSLREVADRVTKAAVGDNRTANGLQNKARAERRPE